VGLSDGTEFGVTFLSSPNLSGEARCSYLPAKPSKPLRLTFVHRIKSASGDRIQDYYLMPTLYSNPSQKLHSEIGYNIPDQNYFKMKQFLVPLTINRAVIIQLIKTEHKGKTTGIRFSLEHRKFYVCYNVKNDDLSPPISYKTGNSLCLREQAARA
jgi:hypothetical protein